ncbi:MAG: alpha/beta hydrolase [Planctomycetes bacterium]|nr:alpha/beta hydrolase [Planctomycetota bacterium]
MTRFFLAAALGLAALSVAVPAPPGVPDLRDPPKTKSAEPTPEPLPVKVERNIEFDTIDKFPLLLDVARPKEGGPFPCVVMFHGGAWRGGSRKDLSVGDKLKDDTYTPSVIERVAARGYVAVSASYRLAPKHQFPAQIQDARAAVRFLRAKAKDYAIDRDRIGAAGFSAGGHLALLLGLADKVEGWDAGGNTDHSSRVQCVVDFFGPADLSLYATSPGLEDSFMVPVFGKGVKTDPAIYKKASPITYVTKAAPPVLMLHGTFDLIVPVIHSENLQKKLKDAGATAELITVRGEGHGWSGPVLERTTNDALKFLDTHLKGKK